jgi:hypothetical protein
MKNFREIIDAFGIGNFAKLLGVEKSHVRVMKVRNVIPPQYWRKLLEAPRPATLATLSLADLDDLYSSSAPRRQNATEREAAE